MRYARRYPEELPALAELLPQIATPVTINGRRRIIAGSNAEFLDERLPNSYLRIIDAGHFVSGGGADGIRLDHPRLDQRAEVMT